MFWPFCGKKKEQVRVLYPYKLSGSAWVMNDKDGKEIEGYDIWVFDDKETGLKWEAFISGTDEAIDFLVRDIPSAKNGFKMLFSDKPFKGHQLVGEWVKEGLDYSGNINGNWYRWHVPGHWSPGISGWLCPALFLYFSKAPEKLYLKAEAIDADEAMFRSLAKW